MTSANPEIREQKNRLDTIMWWLVIRLPLLVVGAYLLVSLLAFGFYRSVSSSNNGGSMNEFIAAVHGLDHEVYGNFGLGNIKFYETTQNSASQVQHSESGGIRLLSFGCNTEVHNHTSNVPFSQADVKSICKTRPGRAVVVTPENIYILQPGSDGWPSVEEVEVYCTEMVSNADEGLERGLITESAYGEQIYSTTSDFIRSFAEHYDLSYRFIPFEEWLKTT